MQLHNILKASGFLILMTGIAIADSDPLVVPLSVIAAGVLITVLGLRESGAIKKPQRSGNSMRGRHNYTLRF